MTAVMTHRPSMVDPRWVWLLLGSLLSCFTMAQTTLWFAAWLAPVFLLRFFRSVPWVVALPALGLAMAAASYVAFRDGFMPYNGIERHLTIAGIALAYVLVYAVDKALWKRCPAAASTLVFPAVSTSVSYLATLGNPSGTAGAEAYSQDHPALLQLVAVTGIWGLVFLMSWFAAVVNALWVRGWDVRRGWRIVATFAAILLLVLAAGTVRLTFMPQYGETVRVAALVADEELTRVASRRQLDTPEQRAASRTLLDPVVDNLIERTVREARAGARIVVWSEGAARVLEEDMPGFINRMATLAAELSVYIQTGVNVHLDPAAEAAAENRAIMFTPQGAVAWDYHKVHVTPGDPERPGEDGIPFIDTPFGRIATIICQDDLFPGFVRQATRNDVDILLVPSNDWSAVADWHAKVSVFRAVENGLSILRPTGRGVSLAVDPLGRIIAYRKGAAGTDEDTLVASTPFEQMWTPFRFIGDGIAWASALLLLSIAAASLFRRHKTPLKRAS